jgi:hypothetical protein
VSVKLLRSVAGADGGPQVLVEWLGWFLRLVKVQEVLVKWLGC